MSASRAFERQRFDLGEQQPAGALLGARECRARTREMAGTRFHRLSLFLAELAAANPDSFTHAPPPLIPLSSRKEGPALLHRARNAAARLGRQLLLRG